MSFDQPSMRPSRFISSTIPALTLSMVLGVCLLATLLLASRPAAGRESAYPSSSGTGKKVLALCSYGHSLPAYRNVIGPLLTELERGRIATNDLFFACLDVLKNGKQQGAAGTTPHAGTLVAMFDWLQPKRWDARIAALPEGTVSLHRPALPWIDHFWSIVGIAAVFLAQLLLIAALVMQRRHRKRAEEELRHTNDNLERLVAERTAQARENEIRYQSIFNCMTEGFALHEIICDDSGTPVDYRFLEINPAFERLTGINREKAVPNTVRQIMPGIESHWIENYGRVALEGTPSHFENFSAALDRWFEVYAFQESPGKFATLFRDISERKKVEEALRESEIRLNRSQEIAHLGSWELDLDKNKLTWSDEVYRIFGLRPQELAATYEGFLEHVHPDDRDMVNNAYTGSVTAGKDSYDVQHRVLREGSGEIRFVHEKCRHVRDNEGRIVRSVGMVLDITERRQAEEALQESEAKYRTLFENMAEEVHFWQVLRNEDGTIKTWRLVDVNPPALKSWGRNTVEEVKGKTTDEIFGPGATEHYLSVVEKIMTEGVPFVFEDYFPQLDRHLRFTSVPLGDYFITTGADITSIKKSEEKARRFSQFPAENPNPVLRCATDGTPFYLNEPARQWLATFGWREGEVLPEPVREAVVMAGKQSQVVKVDIAGPPGRIFSVTAIQPPNESYINLYGIDITEREQARESLERSNRDLEQFAYVASHDLQEPLRAIVGFLQLLENRYHDTVDEKGRHYIERSVKAAHRMQRLIRELLTLSRVRTKGSSLAPTDLNQLLGGVLENLQEMVRERNAEVQCGLLPIVCADGAQISSLFQNLLVNALHYNQSSRPRVEIDFEELDDCYRFRVQDNGIGIPARFSQRIFLVFQRLHTEQEYTGTGLGLALCKRIIERHGGAIWVEPNPAGGSIFYFTIPKDVKQS